MITEFDILEKNGHKQIVFCSNKAIGLKAIIAIHNTTLGPSLGGVRMINYSSIDKAINDVLNVSKAMTYKASISGLNFGGSNCTIIGDPTTQKSELLLKEVGKSINNLGGMFYAIQDAGTNQEDMKILKKETKYVTGLSKQDGGSGDPSSFTAYGVLVGMKACAKKKWGNDSLKGKKVSIQGAGNVASSLCKLLIDEGAEIYVCDINNDKLLKLSKSIKYTVVHPDEIYDVDADIFSPNALGGILNEDTIKRLKVEIIAGGANNQLNEEINDGQQLLEKGILYAPDYVISAGGLISIANEIEGNNSDTTKQKVSEIYNTITNIFSRSENEKTLPQKTADIIAEMRINSK